MQMNEYMPLEECLKPAQKRDHAATKEQTNTIRQLNISDVVQPLHMKPYQQQIQFKLTQISRVIENYNRQFFKDVEVQRLQKQQVQLLPLKLQTMLQCSIQRQGYRSKSQFTIGLNTQNQAVIGFNKGSYLNNTIMVQSCKKVRIISKTTKLVVAVVQNFIRNNFKELSPYDRVKQFGFWRYLIVRESIRTKQTMVIIVANCKNIPQELLFSLKKQFVDCLKLSIMTLTSLNWLNYEGEADSVPNDNPQLLYGQNHYKEQILGNIFQVSPWAFLQIHIPMCEVLYTQIIAAVHDCDVVLDLGCGIGAIGISVMKKLPQVHVIGVQTCLQAVENAKRNAQKYDVRHGRAEDLIKEICQSYKGNRIVAILDPPRAGFSKDLIVALRRCRGLDRIIYVACNAGAIQDNLLQLTLPFTERRKAPEFIIKSMKAFDLFPLTNHYEALYILQRINT